MLDDRKKWEEWLQQGPQDYKPARRQRHHAIFGIGGGFTGMLFHAIVALIPQSAWRRFGWQRALICIATIFGIGLLAKGVDHWHLGMIERNNYYSWGVSEAYQAEYDPSGSFSLLNMRTFAFPPEKVMYVVPSDALAHQIFNWTAMMSFWLTGFGIMLVIWLFWKYPDAFAEGEFRDDPVSFGPDLSYSNSEEAGTPKTAANQRASGNIDPSAPPAGYRGFGRAKTIEAPRKRTD